MKTGEEEAQTQRGRKAGRGELERDVQLKIIIIMSDVQADFKLNNPLK